MSKSSWLAPKRFSAIHLLVFALVAFLIPSVGFADVAGTLTTMRNQLTGVILPLLSVIGVGIASVSFFTGNPQAKQHILYAILGCCFSFGAQQIVNFIQSMVR